MSYNILENRALNGGHRVFFDAAPRSNNPDKKATPSTRNYKSGLAYGDS